MEILFIVYWAAAYWATNKIWWSKNTYIYTNTANFYVKRLIISLVLGIFTIPVAVIQSIFRR